MAPSGMPAASARVPQRRPHALHPLLAPLPYTALQHATAGAMARIDRFSGKFHGEMTVTTPLGWRLTMPRTCRTGIEHEHLL